MIDPISNDAMRQLLLHNDEFDPDYDEVVNVIQVPTSHENMKRYIVVIVADLDDDGMTETVELRDVLLSEDAIVITDERVYLGR